MADTNPIDRIVEDLKKRELNIDRAEVQKRYSLLVDIFKIKPAEAMRSTMAYFLKEAGMTPAGRGAIQAVKIEDIAYGGMWLEMDAKVAKLFEPKNKAIKQVGYLADETGLMRFTMWSKGSDKLPHLVEGDSYHFSGLASDEYKGSRSVKISKATKISPIVDLSDAMEYTGGGGDTVDLKIGDIKEVGVWCNVEVQCVQLWESTSDSVDQSGLIGDETGTIKFTKWAKAGLKEKFEEGKSYKLENVITDEYNGRFSIKMNKNSVIKILDRNIEASMSEVDFMGAIVAISPKSSGLIKRCPTCKAAIQKGICAKHGKVVGVPDLRILASIDNGEKVLSLLFRREETEKLLDKSMEELHVMTMEALDTTFVFQYAESALLGRYFRVVGPQMDDLIVAASVEAI